ncbi:FkbM family methyltransferase [Candidatus Parcubacteria bacterium]|nr:FkbM family methyltransferase [Candidatus Parcubacteria bacterium]
MSLILRAISRLLINRRHPTYSRLLFKASSKYVDFCYGDNDFDRRTNGEIYVLKTIAPRLKTVFDVGANVGDYSADILAMNENVRIHAFEPDKRAFDALAKKGIFKANNIAVGEKPGTIVFNLHKDKTVLNSILDLHDAAEFGSSIKIPMISVDSYAKENDVSHIDFLKADVEGYEFSVIKGGEGMLAKGAIDMIQFEFSGASASARTFLKGFIDLFARHGYSLYRIKPDRIEPVRYRPDQERFTLTNYLAIRGGFRGHGLRIVEPTFLF